MYGCRSLLFVPGHISRFYAKALSTQADILVLDLEDSVPPECKELALSTIEAELSQYAGSQELMMRLSSHSAPSVRRELEVAIRCNIKRILVPKVQSVSQLQNVVSSYVDAGGDGESLEVYALIETARGIDDLDSICMCDKIKGLVFGHEDYLASIDGNDDGQLYLLDFVRAMIINKARSRGLVAIDSPYLGIDDRDGLQGYSKRSRNNGFDGMLVIHPSQVDYVNRAYRGNHDDIHKAKEVLQAYEEAQREGRNIVYVNGRFVAPPIVKAARRMLSRWKFYG